MGNSGSAPVPEPAVAVTPKAANLGKSGKRICCSCPDTKKVSVIRCESVGSDERVALCPGPVCLARIEFNFCVRTILSRAPRARPLSLSLARSLSLSLARR